MRSLLRRILPGWAYQLLRRAFGRNAPQRFRWTPAAVVDATGPTYNVRCYLERKQIREMLLPVVQDKIGVGIEVGCGYGRLTMVLSEFCDAVIGLEREPELVEIARSLLPDITFTQVPELAQLPVADRSADLAMTYTVLQHMTDGDAQAVLAELKRIVKPRGLVLLMEKTDPTNVYGDVTQSDQFLSHGRPVEKFAEWLQPFRLLNHHVGYVEPTYPGHDNVGTYMLFEASS